MDSAPDATPDFVSGNPVLCFVVGHTEDTPRLAECVASVVGAGVGNRVGVAVGNVVGVGVGKREGVTMATGVSVGHASSNVGVANSWGRGVGQGISVGEGAGVTPRAISNVGVGVGVPPHEITKATIPNPTLRDNSRFLLYFFIALLLLSAAGD